MRHTGYFQSDQKRAAMYGSTMSQELKSFFWGFVSVIYGRGGQEWHDPNASGRDFLTL